MLNAFLPGLQHLQNLHPLVVHFPLALLPSAALLYILAWALGQERWAWVAFTFLVLGAISAAVAVGTGLYAEGGVMVAHSVRAQLLEPHEELMLTTLAIGAAITIWAVIARPMPVRGRLLFLLALLAMLVVLTKGADYGGRMVYDYNAGGNACGQPIDFTE